MHRDGSSVNGGIMIHVREVVREIMKSIILMNYEGYSDSALFNTLHLK